MAQISLRMTALDHHLTGAKDLLSGFGEALLSIGRYRALSNEVERLIHSSDETLARLCLRRDDIAHHVARRYRLID